MSIEFWKDRKNKEPNETLFSTVAEDEAKKVQAKATATVNKPTQLRKFFDEIISFEARYRMASGKAGSEEERMRIFKQQLPLPICWCRRQSMQKLESWSAANLLN